MSDLLLEQIKALAELLTAEERSRLVVWLEERDTQPGPRVSVYGLWADQGFTVSEADIDEVRKEM